MLHLTQQFRVRCQRLYLMLNQALLLGFFFSCFFLFWIAFVWMAPIWRLSECIKNLVWACNPAGAKPYFSNHLCFVYTFTICLEYITVLNWNFFSSNRYKVDKARYKRAKGIKCWIWCEIPTTMALSLLFENRAF